jgi:hypothetical protein
MKHAAEATMKSILSLAILFLAVPRTVRAETPPGAEPQAETAIAGLWTVERINQWQQRQGWLVGCNYLPATAINQHEMWSAKTWDPATIARELDLARDTGFNTLRVYLHDRTYAEDPAGLLNRMDEPMKKSVQTLRAGAGGRPLLCTEYMARPSGSTFEDILPFLAAENIGAINWGFVEGKSQTRYGWGSWKKPEPTDGPWFHDIYQRDGKPYRPAEVELIRSISSEKKSPK